MKGQKFNPELLEIRVKTKKQNKVPGCPKELTTTDKEGNISLSSGKWFIIKGWLFNQQVEEWDVKMCLRLDYNNEPNIIEQIATIKFHYLKALNLQGNQILSIEGLRNLFVPCLVNLDLNSNFITSIRPLRCTAHFRLEELDIASNFVGELNWLVEGDNCGIRKIMLEAYYQKDPQISYTWLMKLSAPSLDFIFTSYRHKIQRPQMLSKLDCKFGQNIFLQQ